MRKVVDFLSGLVWPAVLSVLATVVSLVTALVGDNQTVSFSFGLTAISLAILASRA